MDFGLFFVGFLWLKLRIHTPVSVSVSISLSIFMPIYKARLNQKWTRKETLTHGDGMHGVLAVLRF